MVLFSFTENVVAQTHLIQKIESTENNPGIQAYNYHAHKQFEQKMDANEQETGAQCQN